MPSPQEQFAELTRRTQENFKTMWQQWSERSTELLKGVRGQSQPTSSAAGNPEEVLDAVFDFAEHMIEQQRAFAKQMLKAASRGQEMVTNTGGDTSGSPLPSVPSSPSVPPAPSSEAAQALPDAETGH
jgi:methyl-accepting chemotaxis protein